MQIEKKMLQCTPLPNIWSCKQSLMGYICIGATVPLDDLLEGLIYNLYNRMFSLK